MNSRTTRPVTDLYEAAARHQRVYAQWHQGWGIRLGTSVDLHHRADQIGMFPLISIPGGFEEERRLHKTFAVEKIQGSWYFPSDKLLVFLYARIVAGDCKIECGSQDAALRMLNEIYVARGNIGYQQAA